MTLPDEAMKKLRKRLGGIYVEAATAFPDNLAIVLCSYFERHIERPENDPDTEYGWGEWAEKKANDALDLIAAALASSERKDAERYQWLSSAFDAMTSSASERVPDAFGLDCSPTEPLGIAIDAAMKGPTDDK